jgi:hypothetical protein
MPKLLKLFKTGTGIIKIVPQEEKGATFQMDKKCEKTRD